MLMKHLTIPVSLKSDTDSEERFFSGYGNTFNFVDSVGDNTQPGAFSKSLSKHKSEGTMPAMVMHHDLTRPVGAYTRIEEDTKGLVIEGKLTKGVKDADEAYLLMKDGALNSFSIGYIPVKEEYDRKTGTNLLLEADLWEISLVTIPANKQSTLTAIKSADGKPEIRTAELALREAGFSRREAKAILASGFSTLSKDESEAEEVSMLINKALKLLN